MIRLHIDEAIEAQNARTGVIITKKNVAEILFPERYHTETVHKMNGWQRGEFLPKTEILLKLSEILGCTVDFLLGIEYSGFDIAVGEDTIIEALVWADREGIVKMYPIEPKEIIDRYKTRKQ